MVSASRALGSPMASSTGRGVALRPRPPLRRRRRPASESGPVGSSSAPATVPAGPGRPASDGGRFAGPGDKEDPATAPDRPEPLRGAEGGDAGGRRTGRTGTGAGRLSPILGLTATAGSSTAARSAGVGDGPGRAAGPAIPAAPEPGVVAVAPLSGWRDGGSLPAGAELRLGPLVDGSEAAAPSGVRGASPARAPSPAVVGRLRLRPPREPRRRRLADASPAGPGSGGPPVEA